MNRPKVLVVDDDENIRKLACRQLELSGARCKTAQNGQVALNLLGVEHYDVAIVDIIMPEKEGLETIIEMRRGWPALKIVAISGGGCIGPDHCLHMARAFGADAVMRKPLPFRELTELIGTLSGKQERAA